ncbi:hypothetical protein GCM10011487_03090 [Steroidobacter agaridevorans]|uniref:Uncharacterized protein n=1 Tax=Steroidobacter agaridevorans TaxID=2695856 RepID=A0A829Y587_9GAMM|nr:hypothetical protein [Steroidobacter agaridevorans]GFE78309.1 hypothetical protein GCM10011487_03090 [Steroidobacter agaridevorans]
MDQMSIWGISRFGGPDTFGSFKERTRELLIALRSLDPVFESLSIVGDSSAVALPQDLGRLDELIQEITFSRGNAADYFDTAPNGQLQPSSLNRIGFAATFCTTDSDADLVVATENGGLELSIRGGASGIESSGGFKLKLPSHGVSELHGRKMLACMFELLGRIWRCNFGGVYLTRYRDAVRSSGQPSYAGQWLFYLPFPHLSKCLPPDIRHEPFANGILIETTPHMPDANNPADVAAGKRVRDVLDEFGLVNDATYAIEGWPPDKEEAVYEQFISGAPTNRKYTVHCINFDGYDPDRKVLLYAKLFRRLKRHPKEWGLRGWDGPVLNEAKRQVRAAAKAGGVPIEWHIGLEEPAHQARQLLADHTNITEQQLRVIYTPLDQALNRSPS